VNAEKFVRLASYLCVWAFSASKQLELRTYCIFAMYSKFLCTLKHAKHNRDAVKIWASKF